MDSVQLNEDRASDMASLDISTTIMPSFGMCSAIRLPLGSIACARPGNHAFPLFPAWLALITYMPLSTALEDRYFMLRSL